MKCVDVIFISYDGMTDPLGQSQVIPYIKELSENNFKFHLISCEKPDNYKLHHKKIKKICDKIGISWYPLSYADKVPVLSSVKNVRAIRKAVKGITEEYNVKMIHSRSYIPAIIALEFKRKKGIKFLFDMRGFWPDERVDGGIWNIKKTPFKQVYNYFKRKEVEFISEADQIISLTHAAKDEIYSWDYVEPSVVDIDVIPCCADLEHFNRSNISDNKVATWSRELGISKNDFVLTYLGSIGSWYMLNEMLDFFKVLKVKYPSAKFLFISKDNKRDILLKCEERQIDAKDIIIRPSEREDLPSLLSLTTISIFFIKPAYSKKASSPTKMAELLGIGIPVICNANVGDTHYIVESEKIGVVVHEFSNSEYERVVDGIEEVQAIEPSNLIGTAQKYFSLEKGAAMFLKAYKKITKD